MSLRTNSSSQSNAQELAARTDRTRANGGRPAQDTQGDAKDLQSQPGRTEPDHYSMEDLTEAVESLNKAVEAVDRGLEFEIHEPTQRILVRVMDKAQDEVIREVPPEKILDLVAELRELVGILVDRRV